MYSYNVVDIFKNLYTVYTETHSSLHPSNNLKENLSNIYCTSDNKIKLETNVESTVNITHTETFKNHYSKSVDKIRASSNIVDKTIVQNGGWRIFIIHLFLFCNT